MSETPFNNFKRTTACQPNIDKELITRFLKLFHNNGEQTAIMAQGSLYQIIRDSYIDNFNQKGHFVITQNIVEL